jgi:hypothetical protein
MSMDVHNIIGNWLARIRVRFIPASSHQFTRADFGGLFL